MNRTYVLSVAIAALGLIFGYGILAANDDWSPRAADQPQLAASEDADMAVREQYESQTERTLEDMDRRVQELGEKAEVPEYGSLQSAWAAVKDEWQDVKAATAEDWRDAKASFEQDWNEFQKKWAEATAE